MSGLAELQLLRPGWLLALLPLAALWLWGLRRQRRQARWSDAVDPHLLPWLLADAGRSARLPWLLLAGAWLLAVLALAGPSWERVEQPAVQRQDALVIVLDLSVSMFARDVPPSRLELARFRIQDVLQQRREGLTALVVYSGDAHVVTPLTDDTATIASQLAVLSPEIMPVYGSNPVAGVGLALELLRNHGLRQGRVLLVSDGVHPADVEPIARRLDDAGAALSILAVGRVDATPIHLGDRLLRHADGRIVLSPLAREPLQALARASGGRYAEAGADGSELAALLRSTGGTLRERDIAGQQWRDRAPWLALWLLPLAALAFRRGWVLGLVLLVPLLQAPALQAQAAAPAQNAEERNTEKNANQRPDPHPGASWAERLGERLWRNADQRGHAALRRGDPATAAQHFRDPLWRSIALYRAGDYPAAAHSLARADSTLAHYNRGNALARAGELEAAIAAYEIALARQPDHGDALYNRALVAGLLREQERQHTEGAPPPSSPPPPSPPDTPRTPDPHTTDPGAPASDQASDTARHAPHQEETGRDGARQDNDSHDHDQQDGTEPQDSGRHDASAGRGEMSTEQWLRQIPDDPGGLLRRKFEFISRQREQAGERAAEDQPLW